MAAKMESFRDEINLNWGYLFSDEVNLSSKLVSNISISLSLNKSSCEEMMNKLDFEV